MNGGDCPGPVFPYFSHVFAPSIFPSMRHFPRLRWWLPGLLLLLPLVAVPIGCFSGPPPTAKIFAGRPAPEFQTYALPHGRQIYAAQTGNPDGPLVLFIHGTPGAWHDFAVVMARPDLAERTFMVAVDRVG